MPAKGKSARGIPGDGYLATTARGVVYRVPLPKAPGERRARYAERKVPAHILTGRRATLEAWKRDTRADLLQKQQEIFQNVSRNILEPETVGAYLARWLAEQPAHLAPGTIESRRTIVTRHLIPALGATPLAALTARQIEAALRAIPLAPSTVRQIRNLLVGALNDAVRLELLTRNPASLARAPKGVRVERPRLDAAQVRQLVAAAGDERLGPVLLVAGAVGLRLGELLGLRWQDVDLEAARLTVAVQRQRERGKGMVERPPKSNSGRTIALPAPVVASLIAHRDRQRFESQFRGWVEHGLVFTAPNGEPATPERLDTLRRRVLARAGLPPMRLHDLRGSAASILLAMGLPLPAVSAMLGHRTSQTTLAYYASALPADVARAADLMGQALGGTG